MLEQRPFLTVLVLLIFHALLLSVQVRSAEGGTVVRSYGLWVLTPLASGIYSAVDSVDNVLDRYVLLTGAEEENRRLRSENAELKLEVVRLRESQQLHERLQRTARVWDQFHFQTEAAAVIWKSAPFQSNRILINAGRNSRVRRDTAVITPDGVVGRVLTTTPMSAEVELLSNPGAAAGVFVGETRLQGVVQGDGSSLLGLEFIPNYENVEVGVTVYTSGTDRIYPKGLPIGRIVKSERGTMIYREIKVQPFVDYSRLEEILFVRFP